MKIDCMLDHERPILEDLLAGMAILVGPSTSRGGWYCGWTRWAGTESYPDLLSRHSSKT
jgi:hypothetical protein